MKSTLLLTTCLLLFSISQKIYGQNNSGEEINLKALIAKCLDFNDSNPRERMASDQLIAAIKSALYSENLFSSQENKSNIEEAFRKFYQYSDRLYQDSPDHRRAKIRRMLCMALLALYSDHYKAYTFVENAKLALVETIDNPDMELLENQMLGLYWLQILIAKEDQKLSKKEIDLVKDFMNKNREQLSQSTYLYSQKVLKGIMKEVCH